VRSAAASCAHHQGYEHQECKEDEGKAEDHSGITTETSFVFTLDILSRLR
jgi:hypothetical protein